MPLRFSKCSFTLSIPRAETPSPHFSMLVPCPERRGCVLLSRSPNREVSARDILLATGEPRVVVGGGAGDRCAFAAKGRFAWLVDDEGLRRLDLHTFEWAGEVALPPAHRVERVVALEPTSALLVGAGVSLLARAVDGEFAVNEASPDHDGGWRRSDDGRLFVSIPESGEVELGECAALDVLGRDASGRLVVLTAPSALGQRYFPWPDYPEKIPALGPRGEEAPRPARRSRPPLRARSSRCRRVLRAPRPEEPSPARAVVVGRGRRGHHRRLESEAPLATYRRGTTGRGWALLARRRSGPKTLRAVGRHDQPAAFVPPQHLG